MQGDVAGFSPAIASADPALAGFLAQARKAGVRVGVLDPLTDPFIPRSVLSACFDELELAATYYRQLVRKRASRRLGGGAAVAAAIALINGP